MSTALFASPQQQNRSNCSRFQYNVSGVCSRYLQSCSDSLFPLTNVAMNNMLEEDLQKMFIILDSAPLAIASSSCIAESEKVKQFICQYAYQPCDSQQLAYLPHRNMCQYIRDDICSREWAALANNAMYGAFLPNCDALRNTTEPLCTGGKLLIYIKLTLTTLLLSM